MQDRDFDFENRMERSHNFKTQGLETQGFKANALRFIRYLSSRKMECWGFFAAGYLIATIF